jgi:uncharacterized membrane protein
MVIPLVLFFILLSVVVTCWYYRKKNKRAVNIWDGAEEDNGKRDKTRIAGEGEPDEVSSSGAS